MATDPRLPMYEPAPELFPGAVESLAVDVLVGKAGWSQYVSVNIGLVHHDTVGWGGRLYWHPDGPRGELVLFKGPFEVVHIETVLRRFSPRRAPHRYVGGFSINRWAAGNWAPAPGVTMDDLSKLSAMSKHFRNVLNTVPATYPPITEIQPMPTRQQQSIREIAARLTEAATQQY